MCSAASSAAQQPLSLIGLLGAGGQAREVRSFLPAETSTFCAVTADYLVAGKHDLVDIAAPPPSYCEAHVVGAVGAPGLRRDLVAMWPGKRFVTVASKAAHVDPLCIIGAGSVIAPGVVITTDVVVGEHCQLNIGVTISHDVQLGSFVTVGPGAHIAGRVRIGDGVFVGMGANIAQGVTIASGVTIGAGATVLNDVSTPCAVVVGVPAEVIKIRGGWLDVL